MTISPHTVAVLTLLTEALDDPEVNFRRTLTQFADQVRLAVPSYLGVSVTMMTTRSSTQLEAMVDAVAPDGIRSSLRFPATASLIGRGTTRAPETPAITLILYAGVPGALVDLAADLGWLTGLTGSDLVLDQHLTGPPPAETGIDVDSVINQAIGVLLGRGQTPEQAEMTITTRAATEGISRQVTAAAILDELNCLPASPDPDLP